MLIWMREGKGSKVIKLVLMSFLVLAVAGLVLMDVGGFFRGDISSGTIVKGGGINISAMEFDRTVTRVLRSQNIPASEAYRLGLLDRIVQNEVQSRLFAGAAHDMGLRVGDDAVVAQIAQLVEPLAGQGGSSKREALQQILYAQGMSEAQFIATIRQDMGTGLLRATLEQPAQLTSPLLARALYRYDLETRDADILVLRNADVKDITPPTDEQLETFYNASKAEFLIPETRTITIATLKSDMLTKDVKVTDDQIQREYDKHIASYTKPARRTVEQAVFANKAEAQKVADAAKSGTSLKDAAGSSAYLGSDDFEQSGMMPEIAKPVFAANEGDVVGPVQTSLGWHVLHVTKLTPETRTPLADVRAHLEKELKSVAMSETMFNTGNDIEDRIAGGETLETLVTDYGLTTEKFGPFRVSGMTPDGKDVFSAFADDRNDIIQAAFDFDEGELSNIIETADGQFHIVRIDSVTPNSYKPFASVKSDLQTRWIADQRRAANEAQAKAIALSLTNGESLEQMAKNNNLAVRKIENISRRTEPAAPLTPIVAAQIFNAKEGDSFSAAIENGYIVGVVKSINSPETPAAGAKDSEMDALLSLTGDTLGDDIFTQYLSSLIRGQKIQINQRQIQQMYAPNAQAQ